QIVRRLGRGGMGIVYEASDLSMPRNVALKMILASREDKPGALARFEREIRAAARIHHPGVVPVFEVGTHEGRPWYAMALVEGLSLDRILRTQGLTPDRAAEVVR